MDTTDKSPKSDELHHQMIRKVTKYHRELTTNMESESHRPLWSTGFAYYMLIVIALVDVALFADLFLTNSKAIIGIHTTRIILLLSVIGMAIASFVKGWRSTPISLGFNVAVKAFTFVVAVVYTIAVGVKMWNLSYSEDNLTRSQYLLILSSIVWTGLGLYFLASSVLDLVKSHNPDTETTTIGIYFLILTSLSGIAISGFNIRTVLKVKDDM